MPKPRTPPASGLDYAGKGELRRATRKGGKDSVAVGERMQRKTYVLDSTQVEHLAAYARANGIGINELVRWVLHRGLDALEGGEWELPIETVEIKRIKPGV